MSHRLARAGVVAVGAWAVAQLIVVVALWRAGLEVWSAESYVQWDSLWYLLIAEQGITLDPCGPLFPNRRPDEWCGTVGWMPLYPAVFSGVAAITGWSLATAAWAVSAVFALVGLWLAALVLERLSPAATSANAAVVLLLAVFPGMVWSVAVFPMSMALALIWGAALLLSHQRRITAAGVLGLVAVTHSTGLIIVTVALAWFWWTAWRDRRVPAQETIALVIPAAALAVVHQLVVGSWNAYFLVQGTYDHRLSVFPAVVVERIAGAVGGEVLVPSRWPSVQEALVVVLISTALVATVVAWRRSRESVGDVEVLLVAIGLAAWLGSVSFDGDLAYWRVAIFVSPAMVALRRLPVVVPAVAAVLAGAVGFQIAYHFGLGSLY